MSTHHSSATALALLARAAVELREGRFSEATLLTDLAGEDEAARLRAESSPLEVEIAECTGVPIEPYSEPEPPAPPPSRPLSWESGS